MIKSNYVTKFLFSIFNITDLSLFYFRYLIIDLDWNYLISLKKISKVLFLQKIKF